MTKKRQKRLNLVEIAKLAGTSKSTVSRVLRNQPRVSDETRERVKEIIKEYNYKPSLFARGLSGARTGLIGVLGQWMESGFFAEVIRGIDAEARKHGGHVLSTFAEDTADYIDLWWNFTTGGQVDGLILIAPPMEIFDKTVLTDHKPLVLCSSGTATDERGWGGIDCVRQENRKAMGDLIKHLVEQGSENLVHLAGSPDNFDARERSRSFTECAAQHLGVKAEVVPGAWTREMGISRVMEYLETHSQLPDAFVAFNDAVALGVLEVLGERGISTPEQVCVTGWDDMPFAQFAGLTSVHIPMVAMGEESARLLFERLGSPEGDGPQQVLSLPLPVTSRRSSLRHPEEG